MRHFAVEQMEQMKNRPFKSLFYFFAAALR